MKNGDLLSIVMVCCPSSRTSFFSTVPLYSMLINYNNANQTCLNGNHLATKYKWPPCKAINQSLKFIFVRIQRSILYYLSEIGVHYLSSLTFRYKANKMTRCEWLANFRPASGLLNMNGPLFTWGPSYQLAYFHCQTRTRIPQIWAWVSIPKKGTVVIEDQSLDKDPNPSLCNVLTCSATCVVAIGFAIAFTCICVWQCK